MTCGVDKVRVISIVAEDPLVGVINCYVISPEEETPLMMHKIKYD